MTKRQIFVLSDDLTGEESDDVSTVTFALDGVGYEIDLNNRNANQLREALKIYVDAGRLIEQATMTAKVLPSGARQIREWARAEGIEIAARGRIRREISDRFHAAR